ncbi:hypothetical protein ABIA30_004492 [Mycobacterium sp. MAA66]|uniref:hypothetical protein n=1 Tax=Mycobacterium sp. MAA66 TaxID=3156297 RepID=UPI0035143ED9
MQLALGANSSRHQTGSSAAARINKFLVGGVTVAAAAAIVVNPVASNVATDLQHRIEAEAQHRAVQLTSGISDVLGDYQSVLSQTGVNLQTLGSEAAVAYPALLQAIGTNLATVATGVRTSTPQALVSAVQALIPGLLKGLSASLADGHLITTAITGVETSLQNTFSGGWYGSDDGYVFGLFGGTVTHNGVTESGSTLQEIVTALQHGDVFGAFSYAEEWSLEVLDHTLKPLLSPIFNTAKAGATPSETIEGDFLQALTNVAAKLPTPVPAEILQTVTNLTATVLNYPTLKALAKTMLSPVLSVAFGLVGDIATIGTDVTSGKIGAALTQVLKAPADLVGDLLNGYVYPSAAYNPTNTPFTGLLNAGSVLQDLLQTWPQQIAAALKLTKPAAAAAKTAAATPQVATASVTPATATTPAASTVTSDATKKASTPTAATATTPSTTTPSTSTPVAATAPAATPTATTSATATAAVAAKSTGTASSSTSGDVSSSDSAGTKGTDAAKHGSGHENAGTTDAGASSSDSATAKGSSSSSSHASHDSASGKDAANTHRHGTHSESSHSSHA